MSPHCRSLLIFWLDDEGGGRVIICKIIIIYYYIYYLIIITSTPPHRLTKKSIMDDDEVTYGTGDAIPDFRGIARCLMYRPSRRDGRWSSTETRLFRKFFGTSERVIKLVWELVVRDELRPRGGCPEHLLWALHFLKVYPKQGPGCAPMMAVSRKDSYDIILLPGDGIGPEIMSATEGGTAHIIKAL